MTRTDLPDFDLSTFLPYRLSVAAAEVSRAFAERYRAEFGLTIPEWRVLAHLARGEAVSVREIHARVQLDKPKVSRAAASLETAGLVAKEENPDDRRLVSLTLTPSGRALMARLIPLALDFQAGLVKGLGPHAAPLDAALTQLSGTLE